MIKNSILYSALAICISLSLINKSAAQDSTTTPGKPTNDIEASGVFMSSDPPVEKPERIAAGKSCIINLVQPYNISGTLTGKVEFNYRILVKGPCGSPPGTFDEEWIAYGTFTGKVNGADVSGKMSYTANVKAGGNVDGQIVLGQGLEGELHVSGNFGNGKLSYEGMIKSTFK